MPTQKQKLAREYNKERFKLQGILGQLENFKTKFSGIQSWIDCTKGTTISTLAILKIEYEKKKALL